MNNFSARDILLKLSGEVIMQFWFSI